MAAGPPPQAAFCIPSCGRKGPTVKTFNTIYYSVKVPGFLILRYSGKPVRIAMNGLTHPMAKYTDGGQARLPM